MYKITLEINQLCNFDCSYCYLGDKSGKVMTRKIAMQGLEIAFLNAVKHKDRHLWVDFVGGEALLSFGLLQELSNYIDKEAELRGIVITYSLSTNGSILSPAILKWLVEKRVHIKLSIDGNIETHNRNRSLKNGMGSYNRIIEKLPYFKEFNKETGIRIQVTHVITHNNLSEIFQSIKHLVDNLEFEVIDSALDVTTNWSLKELEKMAYEWEKTVNYYIQKKRAGTPFIWGTVVDMQHYNSEKASCAFCGVGLTKIYVKVDGGIYGCAANLANTGLIGNVESGIMISQVKNYRDIILSGKTCKGCSAITRCLAKGCVMNNLSFSGYADVPNPTLCYLEKKKQSLWYKYYKELRF